MFELYVLPVATTNTTSTLQRRIIANDNHLHTFTSVTWHVFISPCWHVITDSPTNTHQSVQDAYETGIIVGPLGAAI